PPGHRAGWRRAWTKGTGGHERVREEGKSSPRTGGCERPVQIPPHDGLRVPPPPDRVRDPAPGSPGPHASPRDGDRPPAEETGRGPEGLPGRREQAPGGESTARSGVQPEREAGERALRGA